MKNRDDFDRKTTDTLAKRVGYICSNPNCWQPTIGPNEINTKATSIGIAAHISAASPGGKRYDATISQSERKHIDNGIWLCSNCATLIDKDQENYPVSLLKQWKVDMEFQMHSALKGKNTSLIKEYNPFVELDLVYQSGGRLSNGLSNKNFEIYGDAPLSLANPIYVFWDIFWNFNLILHNNSSFPAFNVKMEITPPEGLILETVPNKINCIAPFSSLEFRAKSTLFYEGQYTEADLLMKHKIPQHIHSLEIKISYLDEAHKNHATVVTINNGELSSQKLR